MINNKYLHIKNNNIYHAFGMLQPGRHGDSGSYRYGFGRHEKDDELKGDGNHYAFEGYGLDVRTGRRFQTDPFISKFPSQSSYMTFFNNPIIFIDPNGLWPIYSSNGKYLGDDGVTEEGKDLAFTGKMNKDGSFSNLNQFTDNHKDFMKASGKIKKESSGDKTESLWIAHTANNASKFKDTKKGDNAMGQLLSKAYSTTTADPTSISDNSKKTMNARAGLIDVLSGGADPTGGAVLWDGQDFLPKGLNHAKYREYGQVTIVGSHLDNFITNQQNLYKTKASDDYHKTHTMIPGCDSGWCDNNFYSAEQSKQKTYYNLISVGVRGGTIFWKLTKK